MFRPYSSLAWQQTPTKQNRTFTHANVKAIESEVSDPQARGNFNTNMIFNRVAIATINQRPH